MLMKILFLRLLCRTVMPACRRLQWQRSGSCQKSPHLSKCQDWSTLSLVARSLPAATKNSFASGPLILYFSLKPLEKISFLISLYPNLPLSFLYQNSLFRLILRAPTFACPSALWVCMHGLLTGGCCC